MPRTAAVDRIEQIAERAGSGERKGALQGGGETLT
jgi:hypothetical protein